MGVHRTQNKSQYTPRKQKMMFKFALSSLVALAAADKDSIDRQVLALVRNSSLRAFTGNIANAVNSLDEYGCWCYFYDNVGRGKGTPVDEIDGFCKTLGDGYQCAILDSEAAGESCVPWEVTDNCARFGCAVEGQFVDSLFAFLLSGSQIDYNTYGHNNGFDPSHNEGCPVKPGVKGVSGEKSCCGAYPYRFPFKTLDGDRACCGARTYNTQLLNCCSNGQVKANC